MKKQNWLLTGSLVLLPALALTLNLNLSAAPAADTFKSQCAMCHGPDGAGATPMGKKLKLHDLRGPDVQKKSDAELTEAITKGKVPMPAYGTKLTGDEIQKLVVYIRGIATKS